MAQAKIWPLSPIINVTLNLSVTAAAQRSGSIGGGSPSIFPFVPNRKPASAHEAAVQMERKAMLTGFSGMARSEVQRNLAYLGHNLRDYGVQGA